MVRIWTSLGPTLGKYITGHHHASFTEVCVIGTIPVPCGFKWVATVVLGATWMANRNTVDDD